jgi:hypothetical protein
MAVYWSITFAEWAAHDLRRQFRSLNHVSERTIAVSLIAWQETRTSARGDYVIGKAFDGLFVQSASPSAQPIYRFTV